MSRCSVCDSAAPRPAPHAAMTCEYWDVLAKPLRHVARRCGYALAVHGSLGYDIDLVAVPWRSSAVAAEYLVDEIKKAAEAIIGFCDDRGKAPEKRDCGRLAWALYLVPNAPEFLGPYLDLSVFAPGCNGGGQ